MKKIFKKLKLRDLIFFIVGAVIFGSTGVLATTYVLQSNQIQYKDNKSVQQAIDELFVKAENCGSGGSSETLPLGDVTVSGTQISIPYTGSYPTIRCVYGTDENYGNEGTISNNVCTFSGSSNTTYYYKLIGTNNTGTVYENSGNKTTLSGPTRVLTGLPKGVKAIVYLDPTNISKSCNVSNSTSSTGTTIGCMKWYAYKEDDTSYTLLLDHEAGTTKWGNNRGYSSYLNETLNNLVSKTEWKVTPRIMTAEEIVSITGVSWSSNGTASNNFYGYEWLEGEEYWTATSHSGKSGFAWFIWGNVLIGDNDNFDCYQSAQKGYRPVITISKSNF